jgi:hypothetical protein
MLAEAECGELTMAGHLDDRLFVQAEVCSGIAGMPERLKGRLGVPVQHEG